jgi:hypothetical protein
LLVAENLAERNRGPSGGLCPCKIALPGRKKCDAFERFHPERRQLCRLFDSRLERCACLVDVPANEPKDPEGNRQARRKLAVFGLSSPAFGGAKVVVLILELWKPHCLGRAFELTRAPLGDSDVVL